MLIFGKTANTVRQKITGHGIVVHLPAEGGLVDRGPVAFRCNQFRIQYLSQSAIAAGKFLQQRRADGELVATGQGKESAGSILSISSAVIELEELGEERTRVSFEIDFNLMGKLGSLGYPMIKRKSGEISRQIAENLKEAAQRQA